MNKPLENFQISLKEIHSLSTRVNLGLQFVFVINGEITVETDSRFYSMKEKDLLVINRNQLYSIKGSSGNCVLLLNITDNYMDCYYEQYRNSRFECFSPEVDIGRDKIINKIQKYLVKLMVAYSRNDESSLLEIQNYLSEILLNLIRGFKQKGSAFEKIDNNDMRLTQIINFMEQNYHQMITLEEMAKKTYLSVGYLSRYFKQKLGMGFSRYLMNIRLKHSLKELLYTNNTISQIAMNNGFPNVKSFTNLFKETYHMTPNAYREKYVSEIVNDMKSYPLEDTEKLINSKDVINKLGSILNELDESYRNTESNFEELTLDLKKSSNKKINRAKHVVIIRELKELLKEDIRCQIIMVKKELQLHYVGISNLLRGETITADVETDEAIATSSPYFKSDAALSFLKANDLSLFVRIDYQEITTNEDNYFEKLERFMKYCLQVYGPTYVGSWHFLLYEPYSTIVEGTELKRVYMKMYNVLKKIVPEIKVGVFFPFSFEEETTSLAHKQLLMEGQFIDFIGYHSNQNDVVDFQELNNNRFLTMKHYLKEKTEKLIRYLKKHGIEEKPLHLISWNTLSGNTRLTNGKFFRGALVLSSVLDIAEEVESIGFWINTALHENKSNGQRIRIEGLELFHYFSGKRPAYYALMFLNKLSGTIVTQGLDYIMTKNERGYQLILMNCQTINPYYSVEESFLQRLDKKILVKIKGLEEGDYQVRKYIFDRDHGALYTKWLNLNSKYGIDMEIIDYINRVSHPELEVFDERIGSDWSFYSYLTTNAIHYFEIRKALL